MKKRLSKSLRQFIRQEKSGLRRSSLNSADYSQKVKDLYQRLTSTK